MMKKCLAVLLILCLTPFCALGESGSFMRAFDAFEVLMTGTDNVTLSLKAEFSFDGEPFKRVDAFYIQSAVDSLMDLRLYTASGTAWRKSGYCVIVKDWTGYTLEHPYYYGPYTFAPAWKDTPMNREKHQGYFELARAVAALSGNLIDPLIAEEEGSMTFSIREGEAPDGVGTMIRLAIESLAERYMGGAATGYYLDEAPQDYLDIRYEDYTLCFEKEYESLIGSPIPGDFFEHLWTDGSDDLSETWQRVYDSLLEKENALEEKYPSGVAVIDAEGEAVYYPTYGDYVIACGEETVTYDDVREALIAWHKEKTGEEWTIPLVDAIRNGGNRELRDKYWDLVSQMDADYLSALREQKKAVGYVTADGNMLTSMDYADIPFETTARFALANMHEVRLGDAAVRLTLDEENRITAAEGDVTLIFVSLSGTERPLRFTFEASATGYGYSEVPNPIKYYSEKWPAVLPEEVTIDGVTYPLAGGNE